MKRDHRLFVKDIADAIRSVEVFLGTMSYEEFVKDEKTNNAVVWKIQIIGEATKNVPRSVRQKYPDIPWKEMAGMRDRIVHSYFGIDHEIVWNVIKRRLPEIRPRIIEILQDLGGDLFE